MKLHDRSRLPGIIFNFVLPLGDTSAQSTGMIEVMNDTSHSVKPIQAFMDIVDVNIPPLLGLGEMDSQGLVANNMTNNSWKFTVLSCKSQRFRYEWFVPPRRDQNHI